MEGCKVYGGVKCLEASIRVFTNWFRRLRGVVQSLGLVSDVRAGKTVNYGMKYPDLGLSECTPTPF